MNTTIKEKFLLYVCAIIFVCGTVLTSCTDDDSSVDPSPADEV